MDTAGEYNAKQNQSVRERPIPYDLIYMWNLRNKTKEQREKKKIQTRKLLTIENKLLVTIGEVGGVK